MRFRITKASFLGKKQMLGIFGADGTAKIANDLKGMRHNMHVSNVRMTGNGNCRPWLAHILRSTRSLVIAAVLRKPSFAGGGVERT